MLDQRVVRAFDDGLLDLLALVEGDLLRVLDESGVGKAELAWRSGGGKRVQRAAAIGSNQEEDDAKSGARCERRSVGKQKRECERD